MTWDMTTLFRLHAGAIARRLQRRGASPETAADLTQDTFLRVLIAAPAENTATHNPEAYLHRVARNLLIDHTRRMRQSQHIMAADIDFTRIVDPAPPAEAVIYGRERIALVIAALMELPARQRQAFALHRVEGLTVARVGERLGISTSGAWAMIRDAYEHIDMRLADK